MVKYIFIYKNRLQNVKFNLIVSGREGFYRKFEFKRGSKKK